MSVACSRHPLSPWNNENIEKTKQKKSMRIIILWLMNFENKLMRVAAHASGFWLKIYKWHALPLSLFLACSHRIKKLFTWIWARTQKIRLKVTFFIKVLIFDQSWCYKYQPETTQGSSQWKIHPPPLSLILWASAHQMKQDRWVKMSKQWIFLCSWHWAPGICIPWPDC